MEMGSAEQRQSEVVVQKIIGILGHTGFVGINLSNRLTANNIEFVGGSRRTGTDARNIKSLVEWITANDITHVINLAAECGGIGLNQKQPAALWLATAQISAAVLEAAHICNVTKLIMVGTVCSYANNCPIPFKESDLLCYGEPEETNQAYGLVKLSGLYGAKAYNKQYGLDITNLIPVNMYGPYDNFDLESSHVIPALIRKMLGNKDSVSLWGDGSATREFLYVGDFVDAVLMALDLNTGPEFANIGNGIEISIADLANQIAEFTGFSGKIVWDATKPNGQPRRCLDTSKALELFGFKASTPLEVGLRKTIDWYVKQR
jgi:GDP-L-fucose synthase